MISILSLPGLQKHFGPWVLSAISALSFAAKMLPRVLGFVLAGMLGSPMVTVLRGRIQGSRRASQLWLGARSQGAQVQWLQVGQGETSPFKQRALAQPAWLSA